MKLKQTFVVYDENGSPCYCAGAEAMCHEHINDAVENEIEGAARWVVREVASIWSGDEMSGSSGQARRVNTRSPAPGDVEPPRTLGELSQKDRLIKVWNAALQWFDEEEAYTFDRNELMQAYCRDRIFELLVLMKVLEDGL